MSGKTPLILGFHAHVPSGSAESEFEEVYGNRLRPFVSSLCKFPSVQAVLHCSGVLLYWIERNKPELFMLIDDMISRKQLELLGGGFYEPMLPLISSQDRIGQIELMTTYLRKQFNKRPQGCWLPAFAWEQHLVGSLAASGINYTFLSERHFSAAGIAHNELYYPRISEDQGKTVTVFPVSVSAAGVLAANGIRDFFEQTQTEQEGASPQSANSPDMAKRIITVFPRTISAVNGETQDSAWSRFFDELSRRESLECVMPSKLFKGLGGLKKAAFPDSACAGSAGDAGVTNEDGVSRRDSVSKRGDSSKKDGAAFGGGAAFSGECENTLPPRRFAAEHAEAGGIYAKMIFTNMLINQLKGDKSRKQSAREELWKAQDCALFCGSASTALYRGELRKAAYRSLLSAERITREKKKFVPSLVQYDFDLDGENEYLFQDAKINCYIQTTGAGIFELDYLPKNWNYLDTGPGWKGASQKRCAFADWLLPAGAKVQDLFSSLTTAFAVGRADDTSGNVPLDEQSPRLCFTEKYEVIYHDRSKGKVCFNLSAAGPACAFGNIEIEKCYSLKKDILTVSYALKNRGKESETFCFVPELNLSFSGSGDEYARFFPGGSGMKIQDIKNEVQINFDSAKPFECIFGPVHIGAAETPENHYQTDCVMPVFTVSLMGGETWLNEFTLKFAH